MNLKNIPQVTDLLLEREKILVNLRELKDFSSEVLEDEVEVILIHSNDRSDQCYLEADVIFINLLIQQYKTRVIEIEQLLSYL